MEKESAKKKAKETINIIKPMPSSSHFLKFIIHNFSTQPFSLTEFNDTWERKHEVSLPLAVIERNFENLVAKSKIEKIICYENDGTTPKKTSNKTKKEKEALDSDGSDDNEYIELYDYNYTYKYKYINYQNSPESTKSRKQPLSFSFQMIKNRLSESPASVNALSNYAGVHHQKISSIINVLSCLKIVVYNKEDSCYTWDAHQEERIRGLKNTYPSIIKTYEFLKKQQKQQK